MNISESETMPKIPAARYLAYMQPEVHWKRKSLADEAGKELAA